MEPITPASLPRRVRPRIQITNTTATRGRSPAPRGRDVKVYSPTPSAVTPPSAGEMPQLDLLESSSACGGGAAAGDELIFPMSPVLCDAKEASTGFPFPMMISRRRHHHHQQQQQQHPLIARSRPIVLDLKSKYSSSSSSSAQKENRRVLGGINMEPSTTKSHKVIRRRKSEPFLSKANLPNISLSRRLASALYPTGKPSVVATPTAVTVHRSSQPDGLSSFTMEEYTASPSSKRLPARPIQIATPKQLRQGSSKFAQLGGGIMEIEKEPSYRPMRKVQAHYAPCVPCHCAGTTPRSRPGAVPFFYDPSSRR